MMMMMVIRDCGIFTSLWEHLRGIEPAVWRRFLKDERIWFFPVFTCHNQ